MRGNFVGKGENYLVSSALTSFINAFAGTPTLSGSAKGATATALNNSSATVNGLDALLDSVPTPTQTNVPKAYINWILFDEQFKPVSSGSGFDLINTNADAVKSHNRSITKNRNGYLYVYCSNESNVDVFFDNLQVVHTRGPLLENTNYYPFGLTMAGISSKAAGGLENRYKFNGGTELENKEFSDGSGLELYSTDFRSYDPQIGRFHQIDPLTYTTENWSPYSFAQNNPILYNDPLGLDTLNATNKKVDGEIVYTGPNAQQQNVVLAPGKKTKSEGNNSSGSSNATMVIQGVVIGLAADDATVVGVIDDVLIPVLEAVNGALLIYDWLHKTEEAPPIPTAEELPWTPGASPGKDWVWKGNGTPASGKGNWVNDDTGQKLHPDFNHPEPKGPHWGLTQPDGSKIDIFPPN